MSRHPRPSAALRQFLDTTVSRARHNTHAGRERSKDLESELKRIHVRVERTLAEISREAAKNDSIDGDQEVLAKLERTMDILSDEMMQLSAVYNRRSDIYTITHFINQEREVIHSSMYGNGPDQTHTKTLDGRIVELHELMSLESRRLRTTHRSEQVKFWASITIALTSLAVSVYALWFR